MFKLKCEIATNKFNSLENGTKITIVGMSEFGFPYVIHAKSDTARIEKYAQYDETVVIQYTPKGKRSLTALRIYPRTNIIIYKGWIDLEDNTYTKPVEKNGSTLSMSRYGSFDKRYITDIKDQTAETPLFEFDRDDFAKTNLIYKVVNRGSVDVFYTVDSLTAKYPAKGILTSMSVRKELRNTPILEGIGTAKWDGTEGECGIIRYENY